MVGYLILGSVVVALAAVIAMAVIAAVRRQRRAKLFGGGGWEDEGFRGEDALVPLGPPRKPMPTAAIALPLPDAEPKTVEAYGREVPDDDDEAGTDALAS